MKPCAELKSFILRLYEKDASGRRFDFARHLYSRQDGVILIGSGPGERYEGYQAIIRFYKVAGTADLEIRVEDVKAYQEDLFGWVVDNVTARLPKGIEVPVRHTYIFHKEDNEWKIVHAHISVGIPDENLGA